MFFENFKKINSQMLQRQSFGIILLGCGFLIFLQASAIAIEPEAGERLIAPLSAAKPNPIRIRNFFEFMTPAFKGGSTAVPVSDGSEFNPSNLFNIFSVDYEIAPNMRLLYYQRAFVFFASNGVLNSWSALGRDPRFGLRRTQIFDVPNLNTTYDFYIQPGVSRNLLSTGNAYEFGIRTNTSYSLPGTRWTLGFIQELTTGVLDFSGKGPRAYAWFMPWVGYSLNKNLSLQHSTTLPIRNLRSAAWNQYEWDDQTPYMQNGINWDLTPRFSVTALMNNYIGVVPTLGNTWASLWVSLDFL